MKRFLTLIMPILLLLTAVVARAEGGVMPFVVMEYNCENLFDCRRDTLADDTEFLPDSEREWTFPRYWRKLNDIARVIHQCSTGGRQPHLPDLVALTEVENDSVIYMLTRRSMLRAAGYRYHITQSKDPRGIDVALLYNPLTFSVITHATLRITPPKGNAHTRDILYVKGRTRKNDTLHVFVVHAPSRRGGEEVAEDYRLAVARRVKQSLDSIRTHTPQASIIIAGDFNDYTHSKSLRYLTRAGMTDISARVKGKRARGTYKYQGMWNSLDHILISPTLQNRVNTCRIYDPEWLLDIDSRGGYKPRRTYLGTYYHGGVSDHLPLVLTLSL